MKMSKPVQILNIKLTPKSNKVAKNSCLNFAHSLAHTRYSNSNHEKNVSSPLLAVVSIKMHLEYLIIKFNEKL